MFAMPAPLKHLALIVLSLSSLTTLEASDCSFRLGNDIGRPFVSIEQVLHGMTTQFYVHHFSLGGPDKVPDEHPKPTEKNSELPKTPQRCLFNSSRRNPLLGTQDPGEKSSERPGAPKPSPGLLYSEGVRLVVLDHRAGRKLLNHTFDTTNVYSSWSDLMWYLSQVTEGHIMLLSVRRLGFYGLRYAKDLLVSLGSILIEHMDGNSLWTWVAVKGGRTLSESLLRDPSGHVPPEMALHTGVLLPLASVPLPRANSPLEASRWEFCSSHGALAGLCDEEAPDTLRWPSTPVPGVLPQVPVFITTGKRLQYLYHSLSQLLRCPGAVRENVRAVVGSDASPSILRLLELLGVPHVKIEADGYRNHKLFQFYRGTFQTVIDTFPSAPAVVFLDEDVYPSPDFFNFLNQTIEILVEDPSLYCISLSSSTIKGRGPQYVRRAESQVGWGYALTPSFIREALAQWPKESSGIENFYDFWLYNVVRGDRECIEPEVPRSRHYGLGVNTIERLQEIQAWGSPLLGYSGVSIINLHELQLKTYEQIIVKDLQRAAVLGPDEHPCLPDFVERISAKARGIPVVLYYQRANADDISNWFFIGWCASFPAYFIQGHHRGVHIVYYPRQERSQPQLQWHPVNESLGNSSEQITSLRGYSTTSNSLQPLEELDLRQHIFLDNYNARPPTMEEHDLIKVYFVGYPFSSYSSNKNNSSYVYKVEDLDDDTHDTIYDASEDTLETIGIEKVRFKDSVMDLFSL